MNITKLNLLRESSAFWNNVAASQAHFGSTVPRKKVTTYRGRALHTHAGPILPFFIFIFPGTVLPFTAHFGSTVPGKKVNAYRGRALHTHAGLILPFLFLFFRVQYFHLQRILEVLFPEK